MFVVGVLVVGFLVVVGGFFFFFFLSFFFGLFFVSFVFSLFFYFLFFLLLWRVGVCLYQSMLQSLCRDGRVQFIGLIQTKLDVSLLSLTTGFQKH